MVQEDLGKIEFTQVGKFGARGLWWAFTKQFYPGGRSQLCEQQCTVS